MGGSWSWNTCSARRSRKCTSHGSATGASSASRCRGPSASPASIRAPTSPRWPPWRWRCCWAARSPPTNTRTESPTSSTAPPRARSRGSDPLPAAIRTWLRRALHIEPRATFASAIEAQTELDRVLDTQDTAGRLALRSFLSRYAAAMALERQMAAQTKSEPAPWRRRRRRWHSRPPPRPRCRCRGSGGDGAGGARRGGDGTRARRRGRGARGAARDLAVQWQRAGGRRARRRSRTPTNRRSSRRRASRRSRRRLPMCRRPRR